MMGKLPFKLGKKNAVQSTKTPILKSTAAKQAGDEGKLKLRASGKTAAFAKKTMVPDATDETIEMGELADELSPAGDEDELAVGSDNNIVLDGLDGELAWETEEKNESAALGAEEMGEGEIELVTDAKGPVPDADDIKIDDIKLDEEFDSIGLEGAVKSGGATSDFSGGKGLADEAGKSMDGKGGNAVEASGAGEKKDDEDGSADSVADHDANETEMAGEAAASEEAKADEQASSGEEEGHYRILSPAGKMLASCSNCGVEYYLLPELMGREALCVMCKKVFVIDFGRTPPYDTASEEELERLGARRSPDGGDTKTPQKESSGLSPAGAESELMDDSIFSENPPVADRTELNVIDKLAPFDGGDGSSLLETSHDPDLKMEIPDPERQLEIETSLGLDTALENKIAPSEPAVPGSVAAGEGKDDDSAQRRGVLDEYLSNDDAAEEMPEFKQSESTELRKMVAAASGTRTDQESGSKTGGKAVVKPRETEVKKKSNEVEAAQERSGAVSNGGLDFDDLPEIRVDDASFSEQEDVRPVELEPDVESVPELVVEPELEPEPAAELERPVKTASPHKHPDDADLDMDGLPELNSNEDVAEDAITVISKVLRPASRPDKPVGEPEDDMDIDSLPEMEPEVKAPLTAKAATGSPIQALRPGTKIATSAKAAPATKPGTKVQPMKNGTKITPAASAKPTVKPSLKPAAKAPSKMDLDLDIDIEVDAPERKEAKTEDDLDFDLGIDDIKLEEGTKTRKK